MQWPFSAGARIVDQEIDAVPACKRRLDDALRCVVFRHIDGQRLDEVRIADRLFESRELVRVATDAEHRAAGRSEAHTSELQSLMRISYADICLNKKTQQQTNK